MPRKPVGKKWKTTNVLIIPSNRRLERGNDVMTQHKTNSSPRFRRYQNRNTAASACSLHMGWSWEAQKNR